MIIPEELQKYKQWIMWKYETVGGKKTKVPYTINNTRASTTNPSTWTISVTAMDTLRYGGYDGIGFVFTKKDPFVGIDWDNISDNETVMSEVESFNSYAEYSPSMDGIHCICKGTIPEGSRCRAGNREIYTHGRFFTFTGNHIPNTPKNIQEAPKKAIEDFIKKITPQQTNTAQSASYVPIQYAFTSTQTTRDEVINVIDNCKNGLYKELFRRLFNGDWAGYHSQSEADFALCYIISRHTNNPSDVDVIFRKSKLFRPKWNNSYYRNRTINMAMTHTLVSDIEELVGE